MRTGKLIKKLRDIVETRPAAILAPETRMPQIIELLQTPSANGAAGIVDRNGRLIGMVTEREIVHRAFGDLVNLDERLDYIYHQKENYDLTAWDVMIAQPDYLYGQDTIEYAVEVMSDMQYRFMPVVDEHRTLLGIVDREELKEHLQTQSDKLMESKDALLSYFMSSEPYGICAVI